MKRTTRSQQSAPRTTSSDRATSATAARTGGARSAARVSSKDRPPAALLEEHDTKEGVLKVTVQHYDPSARQVFLAGNFNDWQPQATPMTKQQGGTWVVELQLKPGRYEYRLVVDGRWEDDPMAPRFVANPFGTLNSVIEVNAGQL